MVHNGGALEPGSYACMPVRARRDGPAMCHQAAGGRPLPARRSSLLEATCLMHSALRSLPFTPTSSHTGGHALLDCAHSIH